MPWNVLDKLTRAIKEMEKSGFVKNIERKTIEKYFIKHTRSINQDKINEYIERMVALDFLIDNNDGSFNINFKEEFF